MELAQAGRTRKKKGSNMNAEQIIEQIESCAYTCKAELLENNVAWVELKQLLDDGLGQVG